MGCIVQESCYRLVEFFFKFSDLLSSAEKTRVSTCPVAVRPMGSGRASVWKDMSSSVLWDSTKVQRAALTESLLVSSWSPSLPNSVLEFGLVDEL